MAIRVALHHSTLYSYDHAVPLSPHEVRLRPAPHARTPIVSYSLRATPEPHFINWQQDPYGNWVARFVFPEPARSCRSRSTSSPT
jgi:transglutaminase-like putative cysteine protease